MTADAIFPLAVGALALSALTGHWLGWHRGRRALLREQRVWEPLRFLPHPLVDRSRVAVAPVGALASSRGAENGGSAPPAGAKGERVGEPPVGRGPGEKAGKPAG